MEQKQDKKLIKNSIFFILIIFLTYYFVLRNNNISSIIGITKNANETFIILAIVSMFVFFILESINLKYLLNKLDEKISLFKGFKYTLLCFFFSGITPGATGGQPVEVYYMGKDGINGSKATLAVLVQLFSYKIACLSLTLLAFLINLNVLSKTNRVLFCLGFIIYLIPLILIVLCIFNQSFMIKITNGIINFLYRIGIKKPKEKQSLVDAEIDKYNQYASFFKENKDIFIKSIILFIIAVIFSYLVSYFIYRSLGLSEYGFVTIILSQALLYAMASWVPLPGAIGASEFAYLSIFGRFYTSESLVSAMLLFRGITFYLFIIIGLLAYLTFFFKNK